jgi:hypothetical protein
MSTKRSSLLTCQSRVSALRSRRPSQLARPYQSCSSVLCERLAAPMLLSSLVSMHNECFGYLRGRALRFSGLYNAASYLLPPPKGVVYPPSVGKPFTWPPSGGRHVG